MNNPPKRALILMNLGSPASTSLKDVRKYLGEFLMDERVIDYPFLFRYALVKGIIVPFRTPKSAEAYKSIWTDNGSPLISITHDLQGAMEQHTDIPVAVAMRYGQPSVKNAYESLLETYPEIDEIVLLPLYPHYAMSSYETAVSHAQDVYKTGGYPFKLNIIKPFYNEHRYIHALFQSLKPYLEEYDHILFSYHGVPERHIHKGDLTGQHCLNVAGCCETDSIAHKQCYRHQCYRTTQLVAQQAGIPVEKFSVSFQSRLGRSEWLKPYTAEHLAKLAESGVKNLLVACPAFISDCLETLEEIAEQGKEIFLHAGGDSFTMIPCLNTHPAWVNTISAWIEDLKMGKEDILL